MSTHGGDSFPGPNSLFGRVHRVSRSLVPSSRWFRSFVPSFRSLVPSSRSLVPYLQIHHNSLPVYGTQLAYTILITHYIFPGHVHDIFSYIYRKNGNRCDLKKINYNKVNSNLFLSVSKVCASLISSRGIFPRGICPRG